MAKTEYIAGEPLNLTGIIVLGTYTSSVENVPSYQSIVTDYTLTPPNGTALTTENVSVTVTAGTFEQQISITVRNIYTVTFVKDASDDSLTVVRKVEQGGNVAKPKDPTKTGYTFCGWDVNSDDTIDDVDTLFNEDKYYTAQWTPIVYTITYQNGKDGVDNTNDTTYDITRSIPLSPLTKIGWRFDGWFKVNDDATADTSTNTWNDSKDQTGDVTFRAGWTPVWCKESESGNFAYGDTIYDKTGLQQVLTQSTDITCDQDARVFLSARGSVTLGKYAIGKYEVTQQLYNAVMGSNPSNYTSSTLYTSDTIKETDALLRPVEKVSWYDAVVFCNKLSLLMGKTRCYKLSDGTYPDEDGNIGSIPTDNSNNTENLHDMTCDWNANGYRLPTECEWECAARGGTFNNNESNCSVSNRNYNSPYYRYSILGFRLACSGE